MKLYDYVKRKSYGVWHVFQNVYCLIINLDNFHIFQLIKDNSVKKKKTYQSGQRHFIHGSAQGSVGHLKSLATLIRFYFHQVTLLKVHVLVMATTF